MSIAIAMNLPDFNEPNKFFRTLVRDHIDMELAQKAIEVQALKSWGNNTDDQSSLCFMIEDFGKYLNKIEQKFRDYLFPPNASILVNNRLKCNLPWKKSGFNRITTQIVKNTCYLEKFDPKELFNFKGILPNLEVVLSAFCDFPERIIKLFVNTQKSVDGAYIARIFTKGWWRPILIDDHVACDRNDELPIAMDVGDIEDDGKLEIWPHLIAKMLTKHYINYERLSKQGICELMKDLSGMPTKTYTTFKLEPVHVRNYWKRGYMFITKGSREFMNEFAEGSMAKDINCSLEHCIQLNGKYYVQLKNFSHKISTKVPFSLDDKLTIKEDYKKTRKSTKNYENCFWLTWKDFIKYFKKAHVSHYDKDMDNQYEDYMLKDDDKFALNIEVSKNTPVYIEIDQLDKLFCATGYKYSDVRVYVIQRSKNVSLDISQNLKTDKTIEATPST